MRFLNYVIPLFFYVILGIGQSDLKAQEEETIDLDLIYNEWALSISESNDDFVVYEDEDDFIFDDIPYNTDSNLKFTSYDNTFYLRYFARKIPYDRCGTGPKYRVQKSKWKKGIWKLEEENGYFYLDLEFFVAVQGKSYESIKTIEYQILELTEDRLVLQKIFEKSTL